LTTKNKRINPDRVKYAPLISSLVPGLGHIYGGGTARGAGIFLTVFFSVLLVNWYGELLWFVAPVLIWIWNIWDATKLRRGKPNSILIPLIAVLTMSYGIGWQVTEIDFSALTRNIDRANAILGPMTHPDFIKPRVEVQRSYVVIEVPCSDTPPPGRRTEADITLTASAGCGQFGEELDVSGAGLWPGIHTELFWENSIGERRHMLENGQIMIVEPDASGIFSSSIVVPQMRSGTGQESDLERSLLERFVVIQTKPIGGYEITENGLRIFDGILETISLALIATTLSVIFALPLAFAAARNLMSENLTTMTVYVVSRTILNFLRSIEPLIMAIIFVVMVGLGPFAGMLAIMFHSVAALGKLYSEVIEAINPGPIEAVRATGATWWEIVRYGVIPQVVPEFIAFTFYRWDINVRSSIIIGFVGGGGIGAWLFQWIILANYRAVGAAFIAIVVVVVILDYSSAKLRERIL
jgi:phosphonate transport system permease protein